jgi:hypothetical protein
MRATRLVLGLVVLGAVAACGEIVGLGDHDSFDPDDAGIEASGPTTLDGTADARRAMDASPPHDPRYACGIAAGTVGCQGCMAAHCCSANAACADSGTCTDYENCLMPCGSDYACRAECLISHPPEALAIANVNSCVATNCAAVCGVTCGMTDSFAEPDAADTCASCLSMVPGGCADWEACEKDPECSEISLCVANCTTQDCQSACGYGHDAGAARFVSTLLDSVKCLGQCDIGSYWECVGGFEASFIQADETVLTLALTTDGSAAGAGIDVVACPSTTDRGCLHPVGEQVTDADGMVTFTLPAHAPLDGYAVGFDGYFAISGSGVVPQLTFLEFPLSEPAASITVPLANAAALQTVYEQANVVPSTDAGFVWVFADDCHWLPAMGVTVRATGPGGASLAVSYDQGATVTSLFGAAYVLNAPLDDVTLEVDVPNVGQVVSSVSIFTRPGGVSSIVLHPNRYDSGPTPPGQRRQVR